MLFEDRLRSVIDRSIERRYDAQDAAAKAAGVSSSTLSRYKQMGKGGRRKRRRWPSLKVLMKIRKALGLDVYKAILRAANAEVNPRKKP